MSTASSESVYREIGPAGKLLLAIRIWRSFALVRWRLRRKPLPEFVDELTRPVREAAPRRHPPIRLSRAVHKSLRIGSVRPRCLVSALVLYRLLREQGDEPELVIGLPSEARDHGAHAWVELRGRDVGPPPGRGEHVEIARYS